jgi:transcription factor C subunit 7
VHPTPADPPKDDADSQRAGIGEWYSPVVPGTGLHPRPGPPEFLQTFFSEVATTGWSTVFYPPRAGEDVDGVHARTRDTLNAALAQLAHSGKHTRAVLFTHAATAIALVRGLLGEPTRPMRIGCCTLSVFSRAVDAPADKLIGPGVWNVERIGDGSHLKEGALRTWGFEDVQLEHGKVGYVLVFQLTATYATIR